MIDQSYQIPTEFGLESAVTDATALFEQYEPINDAEVPTAADDCENLYAMPQ